MAIRQIPVSRKVIISVIIALLALVPPTENRVLADIVPALVDEALVAELRRGGYSLYFRHEATDWSQSDNVRSAGDWLSCDGSRIRQLSSAGRKRAAATGLAIRSLDIPIGRVVASPYCRTVETAGIMALGSVETTTDVVNLRVAEYFGGRLAVAATARMLLATPPAAGTNTLIVAHGNVAREATSVYPGEGEGIVFQADGDGGFRYIGRLTPGDWSRLSASDLR